jgi:hypothetical protein
MPGALWRLLLEDPSDLTCDECFAVMEYYAEILMGRSDLFPEIIERLERCPDCDLQLRQELRQLTGEPSESGAAALNGATAPEGSRHRANTAIDREEGKGLGEES